MFKFNTKRKVARDRVTFISIILFGIVYITRYFGTGIQLPSYGVVAMIFVVYQLFLRNNKLTIEGTILSTSNGFRTKEIDLDNYYEFAIERMNRGHAYIHAVSKENYTKEKVTIVFDVYNRTINDILKAINKSVSNELSEDNVWDF